MMKRIHDRALRPSIVFVLCVAFTAVPVRPTQAQVLHVGFDAQDITPNLKGKRPVWMAGYYPGRRATGIHDKLFARTVVLQAGQVKLALVSVDLIGLPYPIVQSIRSRLPSFQYVMVSSTHNHEGPDVIGLWGRTFLRRGVDPNYIKRLKRRIVESVNNAAKALVAVRARYGKATDESLLQDMRLPHVKDGTLRLLRFVRRDNGKNAGVVVQWNCHPETLGRGTFISADFVETTIRSLSQKHECPVALFSGALGGLMAPPLKKFKDGQGRPLPEGSLSLKRRYGEAVAELANKAIQKDKPVKMTPIDIATQKIALPVENKMYRVARSLGIVRRPAYIWTGDYEKLGVRISRDNAKRTGAIETEIGYLRMGTLHVACIPGEIYPELVYGKVPSKAELGVDFPAAPVEKAIVDILPGPKWMLFGLANDEIGYIIPRRQWDRQPPYAYGLEHPQYGEIHSCGPSVAPIIMKALAKQVAAIK